MLNAIVAAGEHSTPNWVQFFLTSAAAAVVGLVVLVVIRTTLKGAAAAVKRELTPNGGSSVVDIVRATHEETKATRDEVLELRIRFDEHLKYQHREGAHR